MKRIINISLPVIFIVMMNACQKARLTPVPQTSLLDAQAFADSARCENQVKGAYSAMKAGQFYAGRYLVYQDVRGEDFINITNNGVTALDTWRFTLTPSANEVQNFWGAAYTAINQANVVIAGVTNAPVSASLKTRLTAECKLVRAISYFALLQMYARPYNDGAGANPGLPLRIAAEISFGQNKLARSSAAQIYTQIIQDLNDAETNLPATYSNAEVATTRGHKNTAIALKTRVYLSMSNWAKVIEEANKLVPNAAPWQSPNTSNYPSRLESSISGIFLPPYTTRESILSMPFTALDLPGTQNGLGSYYNPAPFGAGDYALNTAPDTGIVSNAGWRSSDARRSFNIQGGSGASARLYLRKWPSNPGVSPDWAPVIRYAEVMLNVAEAEAKNQGSGVNVRALAIVNAIRKRSDPSIGDFAPATKEDLITLILTERRIELLGEGFRTSDVTRNLVAFPAKGTIGAVAPFNNGAPVAAYIWPIPLSELTTNSLIQQNPGY